MAVIPLNCTSFDESLLQSFLYGIYWPIYPCKNGWWWTPLLLEILAEADSPPSKTPISNSTSVVTPSENSGLR